MAAIFSKNFQLFQFVPLTSENCNALQCSVFFHLSWTETRHGKIDAFKSLQKCSKPVRLKAKPPALVREVMPQISIPNSAHRTITKQSYSLQKEATAKTASSRVFYKHFVRFTLENSFSGSSGVNRLRCQFGSSGETLIF